MYGKGLGAANTATGVALLPNTGDNRVLFAIAIGLVVAGVAIFAISTILSRKSRRA